MRLIAIALLAGCTSAPLVEQGAVPVTLAPQTITTVEADAFRGEVTVNAEQDLPALWREAEPFLVATRDMARTDYREHADYVEGRTEQRLDVWERWAAAGIVAVVVLCLAAAWERLTDNRKGKATSA